MGTLDLIYLRHNMALRLRLALWFAFLYFKALLPAFLADGSRVNMERVQINDAIEKYNEIGNRNFIIHIS